MKDLESPIRLETDGERMPNLLLGGDAAILPEVFGKVLQAKEYLQSGQAETAAQAARLAGISRSAFYKYKDAVFSYEPERTGHILTVHFILKDNPGVLSSLLSAFAQAGANILTVNQNIPAGGTASVSISARTDRLTTSVGGFVQSLAHIPGVERISRISGAGAGQTAEENRERKRLLP